MNFKKWSISGKKNQGQLMTHCLTGSDDDITYESFMHAHEFLTHELRILRKGNIGNKEYKKGTYWEERERKSEKRQELKKTNGIENTIRKRIPQTLQRAWWRWWSVSRRVQWVWSVCAVTARLGMYAVSRAGLSQKEA